MDGIKNLGVVALLTDKPESSLKRGDVGTIVEVFESNEHHPRGCIVEFVDEDGKVLALLDVTDLSDIGPAQFETARCLARFIGRRSTAAASRRSV